MQLYDLLVVLPDQAIAGIEDPLSEIVQVLAPAVGEVKIQVHGKVALE
jgi:hypothetical protein